MRVVFIAVFEMLYLLCKAPAPILNVSRRGQTCNPFIHFAHSWWAREWKSSKSSTNCLPFILVTVEAISVDTNVENKAFLCPHWPRLKWKPPNDVGRDVLILAMPQAVGSCCQVDVLAWDVSHQIFKLVCKYAIYNIAPAAGGLLTQQRVWCFHTGGKCTSPFCVTCSLYIPKAVFCLSFTCPSRCLTL